MEVHALRCDNCSAEVDYNQKTLPHKWMRIDTTMGNGLLDREISINKLHVCPDCIGALAITVGTNTVLPYASLEEPPY